MNDMDGLVAFLLARLDTVERLALAAGDTPKARQWAAGADHVDDLEGESVARLIDVDVPLDGNRAVHITRHDPGHILADVDAKRRIITLYEITADSRNIAADAWTVMKTAIRLLALPYADHPDYRTEWRP